MACRVEKCQSKAPLRIAGGEQLEVDVVVGK